ncbi:MAG: hypothetical protein JST19_04670 [Bacteroidetes bacterium]|nr:hypothetical protein [Bacteroidota bacterium]
MSFSGDADLLTKTLIDPYPYPSVISGTLSIGSTWAISFLISGKPFRLYGLKGFLIITRLALADYAFWCRSIMAFYNL